ncbi:hypothetical protein ACJZ2D_010243 [Fusarium nematophilum]
MTACNPWWQRIGIAGLLTLVTGVLIILASCAILIFLWRGAEAAVNRKEPEFWRTIVSRGWAARVVIICSAAMRTSMTLQIGLVAAAAATAAIILETSGGPLIDTPVLSIERASKSSPANVLPAALKRCAKGGITGVVLFLIVATALFVALASTFISTILLSDFRTRRIAPPAVTETLAIDLERPVFKLFNGAQYWMSRPAAHWRFAETKVDHKPTYNEGGKGDTGDIYRAMLPFATSESRESLEYYSGPAIVTNLRTICIAPELEPFRLEHFTPCELEPGISGGKIRVITGRPWNEQPQTGDFPTTARTRFDFKCRPHQDLNWTDSGDWPLSICYQHDILPQEFDELSDPKSSMPYLFRQVLLLNSTALITLDMDVLADTDEHVPTKNLQNLTTEVDGLWTRAITRDGSLAFSATLCFANTAEPQQFEVTMSGRGIFSEPRGDSRRLVEEESISNLYQLGVGVRPEDLEKRGILHLDIGSHVKRKSSKDDRNDFLIQALNQLPLNSFPGWSLSDATYREWLRDWAAHTSHSSVFQSAIQETGDPAVAVQALATRLYQMAYYDWQQDFDIEYPVKTVYSTEMLIPAGVCRGGALRAHDEVLIAGERVADGCADGVASDGGGYKGGGWDE